MPKTIEPHVVSAAASLYARQLQVEARLAAAKYEQPRRELRAELDKIGEEWEREGLEAYQSGRTAADAIMLRGAGSDDRLFLGALRHASPLYLAGYAHGILAAVGVIA